MNYIENFLLIHSMRNADLQWHHKTHTPIGVYDLFVYDFYVLMNKYDKIWNKKASSLDKAFLKRKVGSSSVGVERFELPISCSQSRRVNRTTLYPENILGEWWDLNPRPPGPQPGALTSWATPTIPLMINFSWFKAAEIRIILFGIEEK